MEHIAIRQLFEMVGSFSAIRGMMHLVLSGELAVTP
jgi:hypothetical protein